MTTPKNIINDKSEYTAYEFFWSYSTIAATTSDEMPWRNIPKKWHNGLEILISIKSKIDQGEADVDACLLNKWRAWCSENKASVDRFSIEVWMDGSAIIKEDKKAIFSPLTMAIATRLYSVILIAAEEGCLWHDPVGASYLTDTILQGSVNDSKAMVLAFEKHNLTLKNGDGIDAWPNQFSFLNQRNLKKFEELLYGSNALSVWINSSRLIRRTSLFHAISSGHTEWLNRIGKQLINSDKSLCDDINEEISLLSSILSHGVVRNGASKKTLTSDEHKVWKWLATLPINFNSLRPSEFTNSESTPFIFIASLRGADQISSEVKDIWAQLPIFSHPTPGMPLSSVIPSIDKRVQLLLSELENRKLVAEHSIKGKAKSKKSI
jgi:hypothetical protein